VSRIIRRFKVPAARVPGDVSVANVVVPGWNGNPSVRLRFYRPKGRSGSLPALLWMHGGAFFMGNVEQDDRRSIAVARELGITVAAVSYRLAPEHRAPAAVHDAYACLRYLHHNADECNVDPARIAIGGTSAGGGLTAALAQLAHDIGEVRPVFQLMAYPVLDDRSALGSARDHPDARLYTAKGHLLTWRWYLGHEPGSPQIADYAAPARREDLTGLPSAWIGVTTHDVLYEEGVAYAKRLNASGVPCELHTVVGGFHGFDVLFARTAVSRTFRREQLRALGEALFPRD
jgi:acetyl esterase/lipase